jgi:hypothetical protein
VSAPRLARVSNCRRVDFHCAFTAPESPLA